MKPLKGGLGRCQVKHTMTTELQHLRGKVGDGHPTVESSISHSGTYYKKGGK
jgi:hypothetical protein